MLLYVHRDHKNCKRRGTQDGHLDIYIAPELWPDVIRDCKFDYSAANVSRGVSRELNMAADSWQIWLCLQF